MQPSKMKMAPGYAGALFAEAKKLKLLKSVWSAEPVVDADPCDARLQIDTVGKDVCRKSDRRREGRQICAGSRYGAEIDVKVFGLDRPVSPQTRLDAAAGSPAGLGAGERGCFCRGSEGIAEREVAAQIGERGSAGGEE